MNSLLALLQRLAINSTIHEEQNHSTLRELSSKDILRVRTQEALASENFFFGLHYSYQDIRNRASVARPTLHP